jgi:D-beta-D-heptose 7-phosphate kinase/D-beta-D-heptose 1-phosphate adenosyltransferase
MLAAGATVLEAAVVANFAAGVEVGKLGAATVSPAEVLEAYDLHHEVSHDLPSEVQHVPS